MGRVVGIAGASGALGQEIVTVLQGAPWTVDRIVPYARAQSATPFVEFRDEKVAVDDLATASFDELDVLIVALPVDRASATVAAAVAAGIPVVDLSGSQFEDLTVPLVLTWLNEGEVDRPRMRDVVAVPGAVATLVASVVGPLAAAGARGPVSVSAMLPASAWGRDGVDELSKQVVAMFNSATPPRKVFEQGLAFDILPQVGNAAASGWTAPELRAMTEVARLTGLRSDVSMVAVPVFSGLSAEISVGVPPDWDTDRVVRVLSAAGVTVATGTRKIPRPRRIDGQPFVHVGRVRQVPGSDTVRIWAVMDNLRGIATAAVGLAGRVSRGPDED